MGRGGLPYIHTLSTSHRQSTWLISRRRARSCRARSDLAAVLGDGPRAGPCAAGLRRQRSTWRGTAWICFPLFGDTATVFVRWSRSLNRFRSLRSQQPPLVWVARRRHSHRTHPFSTIYPSLTPPSPPPSSHYRYLSLHTAHCSSFICRIASFFIYILPPSSNLYSLLSPCSHVPVPVPNFPMPHPRPSHRHPLYLFVRIANLYQPLPATAASYTSSTHPSVHRYPSIYSPNTPPPSLSDASPAYAHRVPKGFRLRSERPHKPHL